jgi:thiol-disulfide isomerase/thioredoxin
MAKNKCFKFSAINLLLAVILLSIIFGTTFFGSKNNNIESLSNSKEFVLIHMNGCGHCERLMPEWDAASKENNTGINMRSVEMNEDDGPELCKKHNITGFPTMLVLENGKKVNDYNGERNKNGILDFINSL